MPLDRYWLATAGWFLALALELWLCYRIRRVRVPWLFAAWLLLWTVAHVVRTVLCLAHLWWYDWYFAYWPAVWICHLLVVLFLLNAGGISWPRSLMGNFILTLGALVLIGVMTLTNGAVRWMEGSVSLWIAILALAVWARRRADPIIVGYLLLYSGGVLTSWVWALRPAPQPAAWLAEFAVQGAAFGYWLWSIRRESNALHR
jgi:hypothetical protein